ncbi:MAG: TolB-like 6-bladed beta-propeller domain-containing protein [Tannerella sp.]|jgi:hypothetical protein|nr:TolB-like 6-bladed beta-propeller domain-containing protein [Tannerella sp.]
MKKNALILSVLLAFIACSAEKSGDSPGLVTFDRESAVMKNEVKLTEPEVIEFADLLAPVKFYVMYDTLVVVNNSYQCEYGLELYSLNSMKRLSEFAPKGQGPEDFLSTNVLIYSASDTSIIICDTRTYSYSIIDLPASVAANRLKITKKFNYDINLFQSEDITITDDGHYIGYNCWYLNSTQYNNGVPVFIRHTMDYDRTKTEEGLDPRKYKYIVGSVNGGLPFFNPNTKQLWLMDKRMDKIDIYNDSLQIVKTISGPDHYDCNYIEQLNQGLSIILFDKDKEYKSYSNYTISKSGIYIIYEGVNGEVMDWTKPPTFPETVEIFKFDFDGNFVKSYLLDRYVYAVSVDSNEEFMYCTARTSVEDEAQLVRYKIKP